jgi:hypothetical protein
MFANAFPIRPAAVAAMAGTFRSECLTLLINYC